MPVILKILVILVTCHIGHNIRKYEVNGVATLSILVILSLFLAFFAAIIGSVLTMAAILAVAPNLGVPNFVQELIVPIPATTLSAIYVPKLVFRTSASGKLRVTPLGWNFPRANAF